MKKNKASASPTAKQVFAKLHAQHPDAHIELNYTTPLDLLVATVLSAQCTDKRVNMVTEKLFQRCRTAQDYVDCPQSELESLIRSTGFFHQKAKNIKATMKILVKNFAGCVPKSMEELSALPGVGRKTANVVLGNAFQIPGLPVDTHVRRVSQRLGLTTSDDPEVIESELCAALPAKHWTLFSHTLIFHGRRICDARRPRCELCSLEKVCPYRQEEQ